jgi:transposase
MGQRSVSLAQILGFDGWVVTGSYFENADGERVEPVIGYDVLHDTKLVLCVSSRWRPRCSGCGAACDCVHEYGEPRRWRDKPWADHPVVIEYGPRRVKCPTCQAHVVEMVAWADPQQRQTRRLQHQIAMECRSAPLSHVAERHFMSWSAARRAEEHAIARWERDRTPTPLRLGGVDEKFLGRRNKLDEKFVTIVSNLETGEPLWIGAGRSKETLKSWTATLSDAEKERIDLFSMDMHAPFALAIEETKGLEHVVIAHDPFHIMKRVGDAIDEVRRVVFFRAGPEMRGIGRGKRWLLLRAWERNTDAQKEQLRMVLAFNGKLARAYALKEQIRAVVCEAADGVEMVRGLDAIYRRTCRSTLEPLRKLEASLRDHEHGLIALAEYRPATGRVEALNNNWETLVRRARGYRNHAYLLRKLRFAIANPLRSRAGRDAFSKLAQVESFAT